MAIRTHCPQCGQPAQVTEKNIGNRIRCANCNAEFKVPTCESTEVMNDESGRSGERRQGSRWSVAYWSKRHPKLAGWTAAAVCLAAMFLATRAIMRFYERGVLGVWTRSKESSTSLPPVDNHFSDGGLRRLRESELRQYAATLSLAEDALDGGRIVAADDLLRNCRWDFRNFEHNYLRQQVDGGIRTLHGHDGPVNDIAFTPDGRFVVTTSNDATARIWQVATGQHVGCYDRCAGRCVAYAGETRDTALSTKPETSADVTPAQSYHFVSADRDGNLGSWRFSDAREPTRSTIEELWTVEDNPAPLTQLAVYSEEQSTEESVLATADENGVIFLRSLVDGSITRHPLHHALSARPDTQDQASNSERVKVFAGTWNAPAELKVLEVADQRLLVAAYRNGDVAIWKIGSGEPEKLLVIETGGAQFEILPSAQLLLVGADRIARRFDLSGQLESVPEGPAASSPVEDLPAATEVVAASAQDAEPQTVRETGTSPARKIGVQQPLTGSSAEPSFAQVADAQAVDKARPSEGISAGDEKKRERTNHSYKSDQDVASSGAPVPTIRLDTRKLVPVGVCAIGGAANTADADGDERISLWLAGLAASRDGTALAAAGGDHAVTRNSLSAWSASGAYHHTLSGHRAAITAIEFNPRYCPSRDDAIDPLYPPNNGPVVTLATASADGAVKLWDHRVNPKYRVSYLPIADPEATADGRWWIDKNAGVVSAGNQSCVQIRSLPSAGEFEGDVVGLATAPRRNVVVYCVAGGGLEASNGAGSRPKTAMEQQTDGETAPPARAAAVTADHAASSSSSENRRRIVVEPVWVEHESPLGESEPPPFEPRVYELPAETERVIHLAVNDAGTGVAYQESSGTLHVVDMRKGIETVTREDVGAGSAVFMPESPTSAGGTLLVCDKEPDSSDGSAGSGLYLLSPDYGDEVLMFQVPRAWQARHGSIAIAHAADGSLVYVSDHRVICAYPAETGECMCMNAGERRWLYQPAGCQYIHHLAVSHDGRRIAVVYSDQLSSETSPDSLFRESTKFGANTASSSGISERPPRLGLLILDASSGTELFRIEDGPRVSLRALAFSADDSRLYGFGQEKLVEWNAYVEQPWWRVTDAPAWFRATSVAYHPSDEEMAVGDADHETVLIVSTKTGRTRRILDLPGQHLAYSADGSRLLATATQLPSRRNEKAGQASSGGGESDDEKVSSVADEPDSVRVEDGDASESTSAAPLPAVEDAPPAGSTRLAVWDTSDRKKILNIERAFGPTVWPAFGPDGKWIYLATRKPGGPVRRIDVDTGEVELEFATEGCLPPSQVVISPDGKTLVVDGAEVGVPSFWDAATGKRLDSLTFKSSTFKAVGKRAAGQTPGTSRELNSRFAYNSVGDRLLTGTSDPKQGAFMRCLNPPRAIAAESLEEFRKARTWTGTHAQGICGDVAFLGDSLTAVGLSDGTIRICDATWESPPHGPYTAELTALVGHHTAIQRLAGAPGGETVATVSADGEMRVWDVTAALDHLDPGCQGCPAESPQMAHLSADEEAIRYKMSKMVAENRVRTRTRESYGMVPVQRTCTYTGPDSQSHEFSYTASKPVLETRTEKSRYTVHVCKPEWARRPTPLASLRARAKEAVAARKQLDELSENAPNYREMQRQAEFLVWRGDGTLLSPQEFDAAVGQQPKILLVGRDYLEHCRPAPTHFVEDPEHTLIVCPDVDGRKPRKPVSEPASATVGSSSSGPSR